MKLHKIYSYRLKKGSPEFHSIPEDSTLEALWGYASGFNKKGELIFQDLPYEKGTFRIIENVTGKSDIGIVGIYSSTGPLISIQQYLNTQHKLL